MNRYTLSRDFPEVSSYESPSKIIKTAKSIKKSCNQIIGCLYYLANLFHFFFFTASWMAVATHEWHSIIGIILCVKSLSAMLMTRLYHLTSTHSHERLDQIARKVHRKQMRWFILCRCCHATFFHRVFFSITIWPRSFFPFILISLMKGKERQNYNQLK